MAVRVNSKFLIGLVIALLTLAIGLLAAHKLSGRFKSRGDPTKLIAKGDDLLAKGENEKAHEAYAQATVADPTNTLAWLKLGDARAKLTPEDPAYLQAAHDAWNRALAIDPRYVPAMTRLIESYSDYLDFAPRTDLFEKVRDLSDKQLIAEPNNKEAIARRANITVRQWLATLTTSSQDITATLDQMRDLMEKDPANAELPYWYAQGRLRQARDVINSQPQRADEILKDVLTTMDVACERQPENGAMHFNAFRVYNQLDKTDPKTRDNPADEKYKGRATRAIEVAQQKSKDTEVLYYDTQIMAAEWKRQHGKPEEAEQIIRAVYNAHRSEQRARLGLARLLKMKPDGRPEAITILNEPLPPDKNVIGFKALVRRELEVQTLHELGLLRLGEYTAAVATKDPTKIKAAETTFEEVVDKLRRLTSAKATKVMDLEGRMNLLKGETVAAVRALEDSVNQMGAARDYDVMFLLVQAYLTTSQPGPAMQLLEQIVADVPGWVPPRLHLADLLLQQGDVDGARRHLVELKKFLPESSEELKKLEQTITVLVKGKASDKEFPNMPEETRDDRMRKARFAILLDKPDEAVRLLKLVLSDDKDPIVAREPVRALVGIYENRNQMDRAKEVVDQALARFPDDSIFQLMKAGLANTNPDSLYKLRKEIALKIEDECQRELALAEVERGPGGNVEAIVPHLERAHGVRPSDRRPLDQLYSVYVGRRDWPTAEGYLKKLVDMGADECKGKLYRQRYAMTRGDFQTAEDIGVELVNEYKTFAASWLALAQAQQALGKFDEAAKSYIEVRARQPKHYEAIRGLIDCYYQVNRPETARDILEEGHKLFPKDPVLRELRLNHMVNFGDPKLAIEDRKQLLTEHLDEPGYYLALAGTYFHTAQSVASDPKANPSTQDWLVQAFETLNQGRVKFPDDGRFYAQMAEMHQYANRFEYGEGVLKEYAKREAVKDKPMPYLLLADYYTRLGRMDLAEPVLNDAMIRAVSPEDNLNVRLRLSAVQTQLKQYQKAVGTLDGAGQTDDPRVTRQRIEILIAQNDMEKARVAIIEALKARDSVDLHNLLASILIDTGKVEEAQKELAIAQRSDPRNEVTRYLQALSLAKQPQPDVEGGIKVLLEIRNRNPRNMQVRLLLAELYANTARVKPNAISELVDALDKMPLNKDVRTALIRLYRTERDWDAATALIDKALANPVLKSDSTWWRERAIIFMAKKDYLAAVSAMGEAIKLAPDKMEFQRERLDMILQFADYDAVLRESDKLLATNFDAWWLRHQRMLAEGKRRGGDAAKAIAEGDTGIAICDKLGEPALVEFMLRGMAGAVRPDGYDQAISRTKKRLAAGDENNHWNLLMAALLRGKGDFPAATALVETMLKDPVNGPKQPTRRAPILRAAADVYQNAPKPDYEKTKQMYEELLRLTPEDQAAMNNLAYLYLLSGKAADAQLAKAYSQDAYNKSRLSGSPNDMIFDTHGWVLTMCGGFEAEKGLEILKDVIARRPDFIEGLYHLGESYMRQSPPQYALAQQALQKALDLIAAQEALNIKANDEPDPLLKTLKDKTQDSFIRAKNKTPPPLK